MIPESNIKDLMLRKDVVAAVRKGKFHVYSAKTINEGIEILTGKNAGEMKADGTYPKVLSIILVNEKLKALAEGLKKFGGNGNNSEGKKASKKSLVKK